MKRRQSEFEKTCSECRKAIRPGRWYNSEQEGLTEHVQCDECRDEMGTHGAMTEEEKQEYRLDQQDEAERETEDDSLQGCCESDRIAEGLDAMGNPIDETIDITPVGCQTPEDERIHRAIEIIDRANSRVASLATEMVETHAKNEQYPCEKLDALKNAIQHRHKAYDSLYKAISGS